MLVLLIVIYLYLTRNKSKKSDFCKATVCTKLLREASSNYSFITLKRKWDYALIEQSAKWGYVSELAKQPQQVKWE